MKEMDGGRGLTSKMLQVFVPIRENTNLKEETIGHDKEINGSKIISRLHMDRAETSVTKNPSLRTPADFSVSPQKPSPAPCILAFELRAFRFI